MAFNFFAKSKCKCCNYVGYKQEEYTPGKFFVPKITTWQRCTVCKDIKKTIRDATAKEIKEYESLIQ